MYSPPTFYSEYENQVYNSVLDLVGNTPLVKLQKLPKAYNVNCEICEYHLIIIFLHLSSLVSLVYNVNLV